MAEGYDELAALTRSIPRGRCASYGALGAALSHPTSGYLVGRWIARTDEDVPWWRVVSRAGELRVSKRDPQLAVLQRRHLEAEGVALVDDRVDMAQYGWTP